MGNLSVLEEEKVKTAPTSDIYSNIHRCKRRKFRAGNSLPLFLLLFCELFVPFLWCVCAGYRHVYLEGMEEASVFVHVAVNDVTGKVGKVEPTEELTLMGSGG